MQGLSFIMFVAAMIYRQYIDALAKIGKSKKIFPADDAFRATAFVKAVKDEFGVWKCANCINKNVEILSVLGL